MSKYGAFVDVIPDLEKQLGITHRDYLGVAINQAEYYGHTGIAAWFKKCQEKFEQCVEEEWNAKEFLEDDSASANTDGT